MKWVINYCIKTFILLLITAIVINYVPVRYLSYSYILDRITNSYKYMWISIFIGIIALILCIKFIINKSYRFISSKAFCGYDYLNFYLIVLFTYFLVIHHDEILDLIISILAIVTFGLLFLGRFIFTNRCLRNKFKLVINKFINWLKRIKFIKFINWLIKKFKILCNKIKLHFKKNDSKNIYLWDFKDYDVAESILKNERIIKINLDAKDKYKKLDINGENYSKSKTIIKLLDFACSNHYSFNLAITGEWGSGKTSVLYSSLSEINKDKVLIVDDVNPWDYAEVSAIVKALINSILNKIHFGINVLEKSIKIASLVNKYFSKNSFDITSIDNSSSEGEIIQIINNYLLKNDKMLIIIFDDVCRMPKEILRNIYSVLSSKLYFKNTIFILPYDEKEMNNQMEKLGINSKYINKLFEKKISISNRVDIKLIYDIFSNMRRFLKVKNERLRDFEKYLEDNNQYFNYRDLALFLNNINVNRIIYENKIYFDETDYIIVKFLYITNIELYELLHNNIDIFSINKFLHSDEFDLDLKKNDRSKNINELLDRNNVDSFYKDIVYMLFPLDYADANDKGLTSICQYDNFDFFFDNKNDSYLMQYLNEIKNLIDALNNTQDRDEYKNKLERFVLYKLGNQISYEFLTKYENVNKKTLKECLKILIDLYRSYYSEYDLIIKTIIVTCYALYGKNIDEMGSYLEKDYPNYYNVIIHLYYNNEFYYNYSKNTNEISAQDYEELFKNLKSCIDNLRKKYMCEDFDVSKYEYRSIAINYSGINDCTLPAYIFKNIDSQNVILFIMDFIRNKYNYFYVHNFFYEDFFANNRTSYLTELIKVNKNFYLKNDDTKAIYEIFSKMTELGEIDFDKYKIFYELNQRFNPINVKEYLNKLMDDEEFKLLEEAEIQDKKIMALTLYFSNWLSRNSKVYKCLFECFDFLSPDELHKIGKCLIENGTILETKNGYLIKNTNIKIDFNKCFKFDSSIDNIIDEKETDSQDDQSNDTTNDSQGDQLNDTTNDSDEEVTNNSNDEMSTDKESDSASNDENKDDSSNDGEDNKE